MHADLRHSPAARFEVVDHGWVDQDVAIGGEEDAVLTVCVPQSPADLNGRVSLAGAGRVVPPLAVLYFGDRLKRRIDCAELILLRALACADLHGA